MTTRELLARHIASEEKASRTYRYFQSWCALNGFPGSEKWFRNESKDELRHMRAFQEYVNDVWEGIDPPPVQGQSEISEIPGNLLSCFQAALNLEKFVLGQLNDISEKADEEGDADAERFLQEFTKIGIESIRELTTFVQQLELADDDPSALLVFDSNL